MAKVTPIQTNFTGGEISPRLLGRVDLQKYASSIERCENFTIYPHGGLTKRSGTRFIAEVKDSSKITRLVPFIFSTVQAYILEFGDEYIRFYRNEGQIQSGSSAFEIASPWEENELAALDFTQSADILYVFHPFHQPREVSRTGHTSWTISLYDPGDGPFLSENVTSTTLTPSGTSGAGLTVTASSTTGINGNTGFQTTDVARHLRILQGGKWGSAQITARASTTSVTVTTFSGFDFENTSASEDWRLGAWSSTTGWPSCGTFYQQRLFAANNTDQPNTVWGTRTAAFNEMSPTNRDAEVLDDSALTLQLASDQVNAIRWLYSAKQLQIGTSGGPFLISSGRDDLAVTPTNVVAHKETSDGCADAKPVGASKATLFIDRNKTKIRELAYVLDVDGFTTPDLTLLAEHITAANVAELAYSKAPDNIVWVRLADGTLRAVTYEREQDVVAWQRHVVGGPSGSATITVTDFANIAVGTKITVTKSDGSEVVFTSEAISGSAPTGTNGWRPNASNDTTADNIFTAINAHADFTVANPSANVVTINETIRAGVDPIKITTGDSTRLAATSEAVALVKSIAAIPTTDETQDQLYLIVERTINGTTKQYVEFLEQSFDTEKGDTATTAFFVDSGLSYSGSATTTLSGLGHLEGQTVRILGNGATHPDRVVSSGSISLDRSVTAAHVGLGYTAKIKTLDPEVAVEYGPSQGKTRRVERLTFRLVDTFNLKFGTNEQSLELIPFRMPAHPMDSVTLFTGDKRVILQHDPTRQFSLHVHHDVPQPCTLLAIMYAMVVSER